MHSNCGSEPFSYVVVMVDCAGSLVVEAFCGSDQVVIDVIQPHGCPQICMLNSIKRLLEVHEDLVKAFSGVAGISHRVFSDLFVSNFGELDIAVVVVVDNDDVYDEDDAVVFVMYLLGTS